MHDELQNLKSLTRFKVNKSIRWARHIAWVEEIRNS